MVERPEGDVPPRTPTESARLALTLASLGVLGDDKPGQKGKGAEGKDEKKEEKKDDPATLKKEAEKAAKDLMDAAKKGELGKDAKAAIELVFKQLRKEHKDSPKDVLDGLIQIGTELNKQLKKAGSPNEVNMAKVDRKDGTTDYYIVLRKPGDKPEDITKGIERGDKDSSTVIRIGSLKTPKE